MLPGDQQRLVLKVSAPQGQPLEWRLNGKPVESNGSGDTVFWSMQPGEWTLEVSSGELSDRVRFQVQPPEPREARHGFSSVPPE